MILHDQSVDISEDINALDAKMATLGFPPHAIHVAPIIRRESRFYANDSIVHRKSLFNAIYHFTRKAEHKEFSNSEKEFFDSERAFKKNRLKLIQRKKLTGSDS